MPFFMIQELDPSEAVMILSLPVALAGGLGRWLWLAVCWFLPIVSLAGVVHLNGESVDAKLASCRDDKDRKSRR